jgi:hypothetical protein
MYELCNEVFNFLFNLLYRCTQFHMPSSPGSLVTTVKLKVAYMLCLPCVFLHPTLCFHKLQTRETPTEF